MISLPTKTALALSCFILQAAKPKSHSEPGMPGGIQLAQVARVGGLRDQLMCAPLRVRRYVLLILGRHDFAHPLHSALHVQVHHLLQLSGRHRQASDAGSPAPTRHEGRDVIPEVESQQVRQIIVPAQDTLAQNAQLAQPVLTSSWNDRKVHRWQ